MKYYIPLFALLLFSCVPEEDEPIDDNTPIQSQDLYDALTCTVKEIYNESSISKKRIRTLRFIVDQMAQSFEEYKVSNDIEKAHYIAQLAHESDGFSATVERVLGPTWRNLFSGNEEVWNCPAYLDAVNEDDDFFNTRYRYSKNSYKSKFRGRGLIQLTGCFNYLGFYYHQSAKEQNHPDQSLHKTYFTYKDSSQNTIQVGMYCSDSVLRRMESEFAKKNLSIDPQNLINDFEDTSDELALPCAGRGFPELKSKEFIVNSSLWYWKKCQTSLYTKDFVRQNSDQAVARMTECIHGRHSTYQNYRQINCSNTGGEFRKESYCRRRKAFKAAITCLKK